MRKSQDVLAVDGTILHGYDYGVQVWVDFGRVRLCGHLLPAGAIRTGPCCNARRYAGQKIATIPGHEVRAGMITNQEQRLYQAND